MNFTITSPNGIWIAEANVLSLDNDPSGESSPAAYPLRRPRIRKESTKYSAFPRTWMAFIRCTELKLLLPTVEGKLHFLVLTLNNKVPSIASVLDHPASDPYLRDENPYQVVATSFDLKIELEQNASWPDWVERAAIYQHNEEKEAWEKGGTKIRDVSPSQIFTEFLGAELPVAGNALLFDVDGFAISGRRVVPWWDTTEPVRTGIFRLQMDRSAPGDDRRYKLAIERNPEWTDSLRSYQLLVTQATSQVDNKGLPTGDSPAVGLAPASLPAEITWYLERSGWVFTPPSGSIFEIELRGVAGVMAHWPPLFVHLSQDGKQITCASGSNQGQSSEKISYKYRDDGSASIENQWSGDLDVVLEPHSLDLALELAKPPNGSKDDTAWLLTETGALRLPVSAPSAEVIKPQQLLHGVLRLGEVRWIAMDETDAAFVPEPGQGQALSCLLLNAGMAQASLTLTSEPVSGGKLTCSAVDLTFWDPRLRLEDFVPLYIPPEQARETDWSGPPPLPEPSEYDRSDRFPNFIGVSLVREAGLIAPDNATSWRIKLQFKPGRASSDSAIEGDWQDSHIEIEIPKALPKSLLSRAIYWFRPHDLRWIPALPLYADPRVNPDQRLCAERTYMPLQPQPGQKIFLQLGEQWQVPILQQGFFVAPTGNNSNLPSTLFEWVTPDLPGMEIALRSNEVVEIRQGQLAGGIVGWKLRYELPLLDELHALRVLADGMKPQQNSEQIRLSNADWWRALSTLSSLAQTQREVLFDVDIECDPVNVLNVVDKPIIIRNLYASQTFAGKATLSAIPPRASLEFEENIPLIAADRLLEGPSASFNVDGSHEDSSPILMPTDDPNAMVELRAGSLVPHVIGDNDERLVFDQSGRVSLPISETKWHGRHVRVPIPHRGSYEEQEGATLPVAGYFQWSYRELDLSTDKIALKLHFVGLPLSLDGRRWVFDRANAGVEDAVLRDFRWGTIGSTHLWGLPFQAMQIQRVEFSQSANQTPDLPTRIVLIGVLHFRETMIRLADPQTQQVQLILKFEEGRWLAESIVGHFLWPLFENTSDLANAVGEQLNDPLPWLEGTVSLAEPVADQKLLLGTPTNPTKFVFRLLDRTWELLVRLKQGSISIPLEEAASSRETPSLLWDLIPRAEIANSMLVPTGGQIKLTEEPTQTTAEIKFRMEIRPEGPTDNILVGLDLSFLITKGAAEFRLDIVRLLALGPTAFSLVFTLIKFGDGSQINISSQQLSIVLNLPEGHWRITSLFQILPGWEVARDSSLQAYIFVELESPPVVGRVSSTRMAGIQLVIETTLMIHPTDQTLSSRLAFMLTYVLRGTDPPRFALKLTGRLHLRNAIRWKLSDGTQLRHEVIFTLRQATLFSERLISSEPSWAFTQPNFMVVGEDPSGLAGMSELPCLATHRLIRQDGSVFASWTAPQSLRLCAPDSFIEEVLLQGSKKPEINIPEAQRDSGFVGALGQAMMSDFHKRKAVTRGTYDFMIPEATHAFWLRKTPDGVTNRGATTLWREAGKALTGIPTAETDFYSDDSAVMYDWVRLPMPFVSFDPFEEYGKLLFNELTLVQPEVGKKESKTILPERESLLHRAMLDRYSLYNKPPHPGYGSPIDQVFLQPEAYNRILPYTLPLVGFEPGWLMFMESAGTKKNGKDEEVNVPFLATLEALEQLNSSNTTPDYFAATEMVPDAQPAELPWQRIIGSDGKPRPYLLASPLLNLEEVTEPVQLKETYKTVLDLPEWYKNWRGVRSLLDLLQIPDEVSRLVLRWANEFDPKMLRLKFGDAPAGYSRGDQAYYANRKPISIEDLLDWYHSVNPNSASSDISISRILIQYLYGTGVPNSGIGIGRIVAERICDFRIQRGSFTSLKSLLDVKGLGFDKLSDMIFAGAVEYFASLPPEKFEKMVVVREVSNEIKILVELFLPAHANRWATDGTDPILAARAVFLLAVERGDTWEKILFQQGDPDDEPKTRAKIREWVLKESASAGSTSSPLLRVTSLTPDELLPLKAYFLIDRSGGIGTSSRSRRDHIASLSPLRPDPRFDPYEQTPDSDPLMLGPDYLGGQVYYEPRVWFTPPRPVVEDAAWGTPISDFVAEPNIIYPDEPVNLTWTAPAGVTLKLGIKDQDDLQTVTGNSLIIYPEQTAIYVLRGFDKNDKQIDSREVGVVVRVPAAGSAVGMAYKLAGTAPGPEHGSRLSWTDDRARSHRWVEVIRDLMFKDITRQDVASKFEPGWLLPATRKIRWNSLEEGKSLHPFFATRIAQIFTNGRPGSLMRVRTSTLMEDALGNLRRSASIAHEFRHPRPVPLPPELMPFDPEQTKASAREAPRTCGVYELNGPAPFLYSKLEWQDPIFNRRLLVVGQEVEAEGLYLSLDRSIYAAVDVMYPEVRFNPKEVHGADWRIDLTINIQRTINFKSAIIDKVTYHIHPTKVDEESLAGVTQNISGVIDANWSKPFRWVFELGLDQPEAADQNISPKAVLQNHDQVHVEVVVIDSQKREVLRLRRRGIVRTDIEVWPQPQNAYGVLRKESTTDPNQTELVAFGWLPKPRVIKRQNRFKPDSWKGTFRYVDARLGSPNDAMDYEVLSFTQYGEQAVRRANGKYAG